MPKRTKLIAGNWKMNTTKSSATDAGDGDRQGGRRPAFKSGIAPPFVYLDAVVICDCRVTGAAGGAGCLLRKGRGVHR